MKKNNESNLGERKLYPMTEEIYESGERIFWRNVAIMEIRDGITTAERALKMGYLTEEDLRDEGLL